MEILRSGEGGQIRMIPTHRFSFCFFSSYFSDFFVIFASLSFWFWLWQNDTFLPDKRKMETRRKMLMSTCYAFFPPSTAHISYYYITIAHTYKILHPTFSILCI